MNMCLRYATNVVELDLRKLAVRSQIFRQPQRHTWNHPHIYLQKTPQPDENNSPSAWKIVHTRKTRVRGVGRETYFKNKTLSSDSAPLNSHKVNHKASDNFHILQVDVSEAVASTEGADQQDYPASSPRPNEVDTKGKSQILPSPPSSHMDNMQVPLDDTCPCTSTTCTRPLHVFIPQTETISAPEL